MNWKRFGLTLYRDLLQNKKILIVTLCVAIAYLGFALVNNYYQFSDGDFGFFGGFMFGMALACVLQIGSVFMSKKTAIPFMMTPASDLEKLTSRILVLGVLPIMLVAIVNGIVTRESATLFAQQIGVENNAENMERFHPETLVCTNVMTGKTFTYENDSIVVSFHGRFNDVVVKKPTSWVLVGINSSKIGDIMFIIGLVGIAIFLMVWIKNFNLGSIVAITVPVLIIVGMLVGIEKVLYSSMSIDATENFILITSIAIGVTGLFLIWRAYKIFCNKQID